MFSRSTRKMEWANFSADQNGQGLTEYLILLLLIAVVSIVATRTLGRVIHDKVELAKRHIESDITLERERD